jgi:hypothetical protein
MPVPTLKSDVARGAGVHIHRPVRKGWHGVTDVPIELQTTWLLLGCTGVGE